MKPFGNITVLFIAGFGPIVRDTAASPKLYKQNLGISFKEESGGYLHTEELTRSEDFRSMAAFSGSAVLFWQGFVGLTKFQFPRPGLSLTLRTSKRRRRSLNRRDIKC